MARFTPFSYRGKGMEGVPLLEPTKETINGIESVIRWAESEVPLQFRIGMLQLTQMMAYVNQSMARKLSFGPEDPYQSNPQAAWKLPVRRITGRYYLGWKVRPIRGGWQLYNDSREAYFIEFGINWMGEGRRVRRPVQRLSLMKTMQYMQSTQAYHRIWSEIYRHRTHTIGFTQIVQSPGGGHPVGWEDISRKTAENMLRSNTSGAKTMSGAGVRFGGSKGFQRRVYNAGGGTYKGPMLGRRLP
jgi:hypothetical protein